MNNDEVSKILFEISEYLEMKEGSTFGSRAYKKAAGVIGDLEDDLGGIYEREGPRGLKDIPGVGVSIAEKIEEFLSTGKLKYYESLKKETPIKLDELSRIEGLGPKGIKKLYESLGIRDLDDLEKAAKGGKIRNLEDFGEKSEQNILQGIEFVRKNSGRVIFGHIMPTAEMLKERLSAIPGTTKVVIAGSYRRKKETIGDLDILVISKNPENIMTYFINQKEVDRVLAYGTTKSSIRLSSGIDVDLRVVSKESYGAALTYFTGSKAHNVAMRKIAQGKGMKLNEYGLYSKKGGKEEVVARESEEEIYEALGLQYVEPEMREDMGEMGLAKKGTLPKLINYGEVMGDLQTQSDWTDGAHSIEELARAAIKFGLKYFAVTDHTKRLTIANGLDEKRLKKQMAYIDKLNKKFKGKITLLKGSECDILRDGTLDISDDVLAKLDVVGVAVHTNFNLSREEQTARIIRAIENPNADILFHPTGRLINKRKAYDLDIDKIIGVAKRTGTVLEINGSPERLDLKDEYIRKCIEARVRMSISSDAHATGHFAFINFGVSQARRGWAKREDIINAWPMGTCLTKLKNG